MLSGSSSATKALRRSSGHPTILRGYEWLRGRKIELGRIHHKIPRTVGCVFPEQSNIRSGGHDYIARLSASGEVQFG